MRIKLHTLTLQCRKSREVIDFSPQITYFHGQISAGKSSIMRLTDYCLGGRLEMTPAISQELVGVELSAEVGEYKVLLERDARSSFVQVTWWKSEAETGSVLAPLRVTSDSQPIWQEDIYNLSDLLFYLAGITPIKVRKSKQRDDSPLVRLSFRDIMWYCYLDQDHLDSSFYRLEDTFRQLKSRDAMRFVTGFYTERMNELEVELDDVTTERFAKLEAAKQVRQFLADFGYGFETDVQAAITEINNEVRESEQRLATIRYQHRSSTHFADALRRRLRELSSMLAAEEEALEDLTERIAEQEALKAELLSAKFKLARSVSASAVLTSVKFEYCPVCGTELDDVDAHILDVCYLCGNQPGVTNESGVPQAEIVRRDLTSRIEDLTESIERHTRAHSQQRHIVDNLRAQKSELDGQLNAELTNYDSAYLSNARELERRIATLQERKLGLQRSIQMLNSITELEREASRLRERQEELRKEIEAEKNKLSEAGKRIRGIERAYLEALLAVGVPGISESDIVEINQKTWMPWIVPREGDAYNFYNAGSGGKKTLLNVCYALAVHRVAAENNLPLPTFLMIDTPMKNIGEDVNQNIFEAFYKYLYSLVTGPLSNKQIIIVDKEYFPPKEITGVEVLERFMSPDKPLISYYHGP